jgi:trimeric autotransporter adhesin
MKNKLFATFVAAMLSINHQLSILHAQGTAFTYQGQLQNNGTPANGSYDLTFTLFTANTNGSIVAGPMTNSAIAVSNGLFTTTLDFGGQFPGADRWLEIGVRTNGASGFVTLSARQKITATPYAISAGNLSGALRVELNTNGAPNLIGGSPVNQVDVGVMGATISGGGTLNFGGFPYTNRASADFGAIGGGIANLVQSFGSVIGGGYGNTAELGTGYYDTIAGGELNRIQADAFDSFVAGGVGNVIGNGVSYASIGGGFFNTNASSYSVIAGGQNNTVEPFTDSSSIGGGWMNFIQSGADQSVIAGGNAGHILQGARESFIGGGFANTVQTNASNSFIGGGAGNVIGTNATLSTIGGGQNNLIYPNAQYATIGGGRFNGAAYLSTVSGGQGNIISNASFGTIGGGVANGIGSSVQYGTIGGGTFNWISQFAHGSTIDGGWSNSILFNVQIAAIGGGFGNTIRNGGDYSVIGGGLVNDNSGYLSVIAGGQNNIISPLADRSVISGGGDNRIIGAQLLPVYATISGGQGNSVQTNSSYSAIPGGLSNSVAGMSSFAAGRRAKANHSGAFVWGDSTDADITSSRTNEFVVRASGGVRLVTAGAGATLDGQSLLSTNGNGSGLANVNALTLGGIGATGFWQTTGNTATTAGPNHLGTTDNQPLELHVNGARALRLEPNTSGAPNLIGGAAVNFVGPGSVGAVIAGGGAANYLGNFYTNSVSANFGTVGGGLANTIQNNAYCSTIGGGYQNTIQPNASYSAIGGGDYNTIQTNAYESTIGGGEGNIIQFSATDSAIGGGVQNTIQPFANYSTIAGGFDNTIQTNASGSTIGGGYGNTIKTNALYAVIPGGNFNVAAGSYSFAAGQQAQALHQGAFVWADSQSATFASTANNQFLLRAAGGVGINTTNPMGNALCVNGDACLDAQPLAYNEGLAINCPTNMTANGGFGGIHFHSTGPGQGFNSSSIKWSEMYNYAPEIGNAVGGGLAFIRNNSSTALYLSSAGNIGIGTLNPTNKLMVVNARCDGSSWINASDRNLKQGFAGVDAQAVLARVAALPVTTWSYKAQPEQKHLGPVAQDFHAAFGLGQDDTTISTVDESGVALAAIQGLNQKLEEELSRQAIENTGLKRQNDELVKRLNQLEAAVNSLAQKK